MVMRNLDLFVYWGNRHWYVLFCICFCDFEIIDSSKVLVCLVLRLHLFLTVLNCIMPHPND